MQVIVRSSLQYPTVGNSSRKAQYLANKSIDFITKQTVDGKSIRFEVGPNGTQAFLEHSTGPSLSIPQEFSNIKNTKQLEMALEAHYISPSGVDGLKFNVRGLGGSNEDVQRGLATLHRRIRTFDQTLLNQRDPAMINMLYAFSQNVENTLDNFGNCKLNETLSQLHDFGNSIVSRLENVRHVLPGVLDDFIAAFKEIIQSGFRVESVRIATYLSCGAVISGVSASRHDKAILGIQGISASTYLERKIGICGLVAAGAVQCGGVGDGGSAYGASAMGAHAAGATASGATAVGAMASGATAAGTAAYGAMATGAGAFGAHVCSAEACGSLVCGAAAGASVTGVGVCALVVGFCGLVGCVALPIGGNW